jgi:hypothetical protein
MFPFRGTRTIVGKCGHDETEEYRRLAQQCLETGAEHQQPRGASYLGPDGARARDIGAAKFPLRSLGQLFDSNSRSNPRTTRKSRQAATQHQN